MNTIDISINPIQLSYFTSGMKMKVGEKIKKRKVYDYEVEFIDASYEGKEYINGKIIDVNKNDIVFRKPGDITQAIMKYSCYLICFDLSNKIKSNLPISHIRETGKVQKLSDDKLTQNLELITHTTKPEYYKNLFEESMQNVIDYSPLSILKIKSNILRILVALYEEQKGLIKLKSPYYNILKEAKKFMNDNLSKKISISEIANQTNLSKNYFHEIFTKEMGFTPIEYLNNLRLQKSKMLLVYSNYQIKRIAIETGFNSYAYFSFFFKKKTKISPSEFRKKFRQ